MFPLHVCVEPICLVSSNVLTGISIRIADISDSEWRKMGAMQRKAHIQRRSRDKKKEKEAASREEKARLEKGRDRSQARSPR